VVLISRWITRLTVCRASERRQCVCVCWTMFVCLLCLICYYCFDYELTPFNVLVKLLRSELLIGIELLSMKFCVDVISRTCFQRTMIWCCMENICVVVAGAMPEKCCVPGCRGNYQATAEREEEKVSVFRFPKDSDFQSHVRSGYVSHQEPTCRSTTRPLSVRNTLHHTL